MAGAFWLLWIASSVMATVAARMYENAAEAGDNDAARTSILFFSGSLVLSIICWLLLAHFVRSVQKSQAPHEISA